MDELAEEIHRFWFDDCFSSPEAAGVRLGRWFAGSAAFDREIQSRFGSLPSAALAGAFDAWMSEAQSSVSLVIVLDQFPRNCFRGTRDAFATDARALAVSLASIESEFDRRLHVMEALVLYMPLEHSESLVIQERSVASFEALAGRASAGFEPLIAQSIDYARRHRNVIERWGRFPHRNTALGRESTAAEVEWLAAGGDSFEAELRED